LDHLGIEKVAVVGLSMGGYVAVNFTLAYPERTTALIPVDAIIESRPMSKEYMDTLTPVFTKAKEEGIESARQVWINLPLFAPARRDPTCAGKLDEIVGRYSGWNFVNDDSIVRLSPVPERRLHEIKVPTLIVVGELDVPDCLEVGDVLGAGIRGSEKVVIGNVGHMSNMEDPETFNRAVLGFLAKTLR